MEQTRKAGGRKVSIFTADYKFANDMAMNIRKKVALALFFIGFIASLMVVPMTICRPLGFRGTSTSATHCEFQGYFPVFSRPTTPYTDTTQIRIDHGRVFVAWASLILLCILIGTDYKKAQKS
jgi:hypothetical protein